MTAAGTGNGWLCFSGLDWWYHSRGHSDFQLMLQIAEHQPVLVINSVGMRMPLPGRSPGALRRIARKGRAMSRGLRAPLADLPRFHVMTPLLIPLYGSRLGRLLNTRLIRLQVRWAMRRLGIQTPDCMVTLPTAWEVVRGLQVGRIVVNRCDRYSTFHEADGAYIRSLEENLLANADVAVYVSHTLMEEERPLARGNVAYLDHGVDLELFRPRSYDEVPADLRAIPRPRIGFFGMIDDYTVDVGLLRMTAEAHPQANLVLIGDVTCPIDDLSSLPNVHRLGVRDHADIPAYGSGFDVALMPWLDNDWIRYCNPIKLKEYLALGLPVVSTWFPEVAAYEDVITVVRSREGFVDAVGRALAGGQTADAPSMLAAVSDASWASRASQLLEIIDGVDVPCAVS